MYVDTITKQIKSWIPELTDLFSVTISISQIDITSGLCTCTTPVDHNLQTGDYIYVKGAIIPIKITDIVKDNPTDEIATVTTQTYHDQTKDPDSDDVVTVDISGVGDALYNGTKTITEDIDGYNYTIEIDSGASDNPDVTNAYMFIYKYQKVNGWKQITKIDDTHFTYQETDTSLNATITNAGITLTKNQRIFNCLDAEDAMYMYCNSFGNLKDGELESVKFKSDDDLTMYVSLNCQNRNLNTVNNSEGLYEYTINLFVFKPVKNSYKYTARDAMSFLEAKVLNPILGNKSLTTDDLHVVDQTEDLKFVGGMPAYKRDRVLYVHRFDYTFRVKIDSLDLQLPIDSVRFNKFEYSWTSQDDSGVLNSFIIDY